MLSASKIFIKRSSVPGSVPNQNQLEPGELALNLADKKIFFKNTQNNISSIEDSPYTFLENLSSVVFKVGNNTTTGVYSEVFGGYNNDVSGSGSAVINGENNDIVGDFALIGNGLNNTIGIDGDYSAVLGGKNNTLNHSESFIIGSNITSHLSGFTYVNNLSVLGKVYGDGSELNGITGEGSGIDTGVRALTSNWESTYTTVQTNSANWSTGGGTSLSTVIDYLSTNNVFLSSAQIGSQTQSPTLFVRGQKVGVNTESPNQALTVIGNVSSTGLYYGDGSQLTGIVAGDTVATTLVRTNSANWELAPSVYTTVQSNSANWNYQGTDLKALSANWQSTYTTVQSNSATWGTGGTDLTTVINYLSTNNVFLSSAQVGPQEQTTATLFARGYKVGVNTESPNQALTVVGSVSATGSYYGDGSQLTGIVAGDTEATTLVRTNSASWDLAPSVHTTVQANSATWNYQGTDLKALSANWQSTYTTVQTNSANWGTGGGGLYLPLSGGNLTGTVTTTSIISSTNVVYASGERVIVGQSTDTTPVYKIRAMTQMEYNALGVYDDNTIYFIKQ